MINRNQSIEILKKLGLGEYESQIVLVLLGLGAAKVSQISKICLVPRNKIYESLENLSKKGIVQIIPSSPKKFLIKNVDSLKVLIREKEENIQSLKEDFEKLKKTEKSKILDSVNEPVGIVYGHHAFVSKLKEALENVSKENLIVAKKVRADPILIRLSERAIKRGVKIRMLIPETNLDKIKEWKKIGVEVRFMKNSPEIVFSSFDDKLCRINFQITEDGNDPTIWIENKQFISILREKFESMWKTSKY